MKIEKFVVMALVVLLSACGGNGEGTAGDGDGDEYQGPTYHSDIKPLMEAHCTGCHVQDSIAPFALETYEEVRDTAILSHATMTSGVMPPWPPSDDCGPPLQGHRAMESAEIALFKEWMDLGRVEGEPVGGQEPAGESENTLGRSPDLTLDWGFDYKPQPVGGDGIDDYRCFVVDPELEEDKFVSLVDTRPGNAEVVHHMIAYMATEEHADQIESLQAEDGREGYTCFGGPRLSNSEMLAGWVPGTQPVPYKAGHGVRMQAGSRLVVQMHYNTLNDPEGTDRTELDLYFVDEEEHPNPTELVMVPLAQGGLFVEAGDPDGVAYAEGPDIPLPIMLHGIAPHMHTLGTEILVEVDSGEEDMCLIHIPEWDFNWQGFYLYEEPFQLQPPAKTRMTCRYDNSAENQPPGREPQDVTWGDGTYDEMCLVYFIIERPPGF